MDPLLMTMLAVLLALTCFGLIVIVGVAVVEALRLPRDLPDELRFTAPVPADDDGRPPLERAAAYQALASAGEAAHRVHVDAWAVVMAADSHDDADLQTAAQEARRLAEDAATAWQAHDIDTCARCQTECSALRQRIARRLAELPDPRRRRILILLGLLVIMILWLVILTRIQGL